MRKVIAALTTLALTAAVSGCGAGQAETASDLPEGAVDIQLSDDGITVDGQSASADAEDPVYTAHDIVYYEDGHDFTYGEGTEADAHSTQEAEAHTVLHITQPGTYALSGTLSAGQVAVDLGDEAEEDPDAVVTLILNGVDITCTVAPAVIFYNVYECGSKDQETADVDTSAAGANVVIADGTVNNISGSYVARIYKEYTLSDDGTEVVDSKKLHKYDGAFYSKMSMNVDGGEVGDGVLNITGENEGLDTELHLTINGGVINIASGNDGINTNEDGVSVTTVNGGTLTIQVTGETGEGDGIDSNGFLVINGGTVSAWACSDSMDAGLDADMGIQLNGGTVLAAGNMYDQIDGGEQTYVALSFASRQSGGQTYTLKNEAEETVLEAAPANDFTYLVLSGSNLTAGDYTLWCGDIQLAGAASDGMGGPGMGGGMGQSPAGEAPPDSPDAAPDRGPRPEDGEPPQDGTAPEKGEPPQDGVPPERDMARPGGQDTQTAEISVTFSLAEGGNFFTAVAPAQTGQEAEQ